MFTGIVEEIGTVVDARSGGLTIQADVVLRGLAVSHSMCVNGACLTVTELGDNSFVVDVVPETLRRTNLGSLEVGSRVNLERALPASGRFDGHVVQGHVDGTGRIRSINTDGKALMTTIGTDPSTMRYVVEKGFMAVDGVSLTIVDCGEESFSVTIIPFTKDHTIIGSWKVGHIVNLEADILAKYVDKLIAVGTKTDR